MKKKIVMLSDHIRDYHMYTRKCRRYFFIYMLPTYY
jgi:hypothetical protein